MLADSLIVSSSNSLKILLDLFSRCIFKTSYTTCMVGRRDLPVITEGGMNSPRDFCPRGWPYEPPKPHAPVDRLWCLPLISSRFVVKYSAYTLFAIKKRKQKQNKTIFSLKYRMIIYINSFTLHQFLKKELKFLTKKQQKKDIWVVPVKELESRDWKLRTGEKDLQQKHYVEDCSYHIENKIHLCSPTAKAKRETLWITFMSRRTKRKPISLSGEREVLLSQNSKNSLSSQGYETISWLIVKDSQPALRKMKKVSARRNWSSPNLIQLTNPRRS